MYLIIELKNNPAFLRASIPERLSNQIESWAGGRTFLVETLLDKGRDHLSKLKVVAEVVRHSSLAVGERMSRLNTLAICSRTNSLSRTVLVKKKNSEKGQIEYRSVARMSGS